MEFTMRTMTPETAAEISGWSYFPPYDFYNMGEFEENALELQNGEYLCVMDYREHLVGFYCSGASAQVPTGHRFEAYTGDAVDIGLGMRPDLTGRGLGYDFCVAILQSVRTRFPGKSQRLTVATFNRRAIHLYRKLGFVEHIQFTHHDVEFMTMLRRKAPPTPSHS